MFKVVSLSDLMLKRGKSINPLSNPDKEFELYSIPAYENKTPEFLRGIEIGSSKQILVENDVLLSRIVPHIRRAWIVKPQSNRTLIGSGEWVVFRSEKADPGYLRNFLLSDVFHQQMMTTVRGVGGSLLRASPELIGKIEIPLPPLEVQKKIAAVLEKADTLRRKREEQIKRLDDLLQATFLDMFGDPVTNPKGWPVSNLEEIGEITTGSTPPTKEKNMFDGEIPFITPGDLKESWVSAARTVTEDGAKKSRTVMKGATLVCCIGATIGKMGKAAEYAAFNQQINAISWGSLVEHNFGLEMMKFFKQKIALAGASTTLPILNKGLFKKISIPVPPLTLQNSFSKIIHSIEIQKKFFLEQLKTSNNLFASLMQRAFKGELELK